MKDRASKPSRDGGLRQNPFRNSQIDAFFFALPCLYIVFICHGPLRLHVVQFLELSIGRTLVQFPFRYLSLRELRLRLLG